MSRYIKFHKPFGVVSTFTDLEGHRTLKEFINVPGVYTAGRLDLDSEGLLFLTDDGVMINLLTDPRHLHWKIYHVMVEGMITSQAIHQLETGVNLKGYRTRPAKVRVIDPPVLPEREKPVTPHGPTGWLEITLFEGKKRQIRHMTAAVGLPTLRLIRIAIGPLQLGSLQRGDWVELTSIEVDALKKSIIRPGKGVKREIHRPKS